MLLPSPTCLWRQQLLSLPSAVLSVCLSFWPVFRSLPVCWSAFILAFFSYSSCQLILKPYFLPVFSPLYFPFLSYLCHSLFTTNFISLFPLVLLSYLSHSSAPPLTIPISFPIIPASFLLFVAPGVEVLLRYSGLLQSCPRGPRGLSVSMCFRKCFF